MVNDIHSIRDNQEDGFWLAHLNLVTHFDIQKLWKFNFPQGLAPGLLDGFLIGRNEKKRESFNLFAVKIESRAMWFSRGKFLRCWSCSKYGFCPCPSIIRNSKQQTQNPSKSLQKLLLRQKDDNIVYCLLFVYQKLYKWKK